MRAAAHTAALLLALATCASCSDSHPAVDAGADAGSDAGVDAGPCAGPCDDGNACTSDACDGTTCTHEALPNGTTCGGRFECAYARCALAIGPPAELVSRQGLVAFALVGDLDADGLADPVLFFLGLETSPGTPRLAQLVAMSTASGALLWSWTGDAGSGDVRLVALGDLDGDTITDFAFSDPAYAVAAGRVSVFSGRDGHVLWRRDGVASLLELGTNVQPVPDRDGDDVADVFITAPNGGLSGYPFGMAGMYSGRTGDALIEWMPDSPSYRNVFLVGPDGVGVIVTVNGDGVIRFAPPGELASRTTPAPATLGFRTRGVGADYDGDGYRDLLLCNSRSISTPTCILISTQSGEQLTRYTGSMALLGDAPATLGSDIDDDGREDLLGLGEIWESELLALPSGRVRCRLHGFPAFVFGPDADGDGRGELGTVIPRFEVAFVLLSSTSWGGSCT